MRASRDGGNQIHIQSRGVGSQNCTRLAHLIQGAEDVLFDRQTFEDRLDHQIDLGNVCIFQGPRDQGHTHFELLRGQFAAFDAAVVLLANMRQPSIQRFTLEFQQGDRNAGVGKIHGDATAHGACTNHGNTAH
ncbi:hypothetical protein D3C84_652370 [compost metagenome]